MRKMWAILFGAVVIIFSISYPGLNKGQVRAQLLNGDVLYVGGDGPNNYTTISAALNAAHNGDTIFVYSGTYYENVVITKRVSLIGENVATTIIDGGNKGNVIHVLSNNVIISGFTITHSGWEDNEAGIMINADYCKISDCMIVDNNRGIYGEYANLNTIVNCTVTDSGGYSNIAFYYSSYNHLENLLVRRSKLSGIYFGYGEHNSIEKCYIEDCYEGYGIGIDYSSGCTISNCTMRKALNGIKLYGSDNNVLYNNTVIENEYSGIALYASSDENILIKCHSGRNGRNGIYMGKNGCDGNVIEECFLIENSMCGIYIESSSNENTIKKCDIRSNEGCGVYITASEDNNITMCNIKNNGQIGVYLKKCQGTTYVNYNNIYGNGWGLWANGSICDARYNYWGSIFGPLTFGLLGDGIGWSENGRIAFFPWSITEIKW